MEAVEGQLATLQRHFEAVVTENQALQKRVFELQHKQHLLQAIAAA